MRIAESQLTAAKAKLSTIVEGGREAVQSSLQALRDMQVKDHLVPALKLAGGVAAGEDGRSLVIGNGITRNVHPNAVAQLASRPKDTGGNPLFSGKLITELLAHGRADIAASWLRTAYQAEELVKPSSSFLVRTVQNAEDGPEVRAVLSDRFRRMDSAPIVEMTTQALIEAGAVPLNARNGDVRWYQNWVSPHVFQAGGEAYLAGYRFGNSDFGCGTMFAESFIWRLICLNGMSAEALIRKVHLGKRLSGDVAWSQRTCDLDTQTMASASHDAVTQAFNKDNLRRRFTAMQNAYDEQVDPNKRLEALRKASKLTQNEVDATLAVIQTSDVELVPVGNGNTRAQLANAISAVANQEGVSFDRTIDLQSIAGTLAGVGGKPKTELLTWDDICPAEARTVQAEPAYQPVAVDDVF